jgi:hypothetical protein
MKLAPLAIAATFALVSAAVFAQTPTAPTDPAKAPGINQRKDNQQDRIGQGVKSGELTAGETSHLEHQEAGINKEESGMKAEDNGKLTQQDRKTLTHQQNQESRRIYRDKHNTRVR